MKYRKRPVEIEAMQLTEANEREVAEWCGGRVSSATRYGKPIGGVLIDTLEGTMRADVGDWIIRGVQGEFYPCKPDIFEATYESAEMVALDYGQMGEAFKKAARLAGLDGSPE